MKYSWNLFLLILEFLEENFLESFETSIDSINSLTKMQSVLSNLILLYQRGIFLTWFFLNINKENIVILCIISIFKNRYEITWYDTKVEHFTRVERLMI